MAGLSRWSWDRYRGVALLPLLLVLGACSSDKIIFNYPGEQMDMNMQGLEPPALYVDDINDLRPAVQRTGEGKFLHIQFPKDSSWIMPAIEIYGESLVQDIEQTALVELVDYPEQADYFLSVDVMSMTCTFDRSIWNFLGPLAMGLGIGMVASDDASHGVSTGLVAGVVGMLAIPMPSHSEAETVLRVVLKDVEGQIVWQDTCVGSVGDRVYAAATARQDQEYVDRFLTRSVKKANACVLGQLRPLLIELGQPGS